MQKVASGDRTVLRLVMVLIICILSVGIYYLHAFADNSGIEQSFSNATKTADELTPTQ